MNPRHSLTRIRTLCVFSCLLAQIALYSSPTSAEEFAPTVKMDGKTIFIPEVKLTRKVNPVTSFLYIGSWKQPPKKKNIQELLCEIDPENDMIPLRSTGALLKNSKTRVVTRSNVNSYLNQMTRNQRQATHIAFKVVTDKRQSAVIEAFSDSDIVVFNNGKPAGSMSQKSALIAGGHEYLPVMLEKGVNIINIKQYSSGKPRLQMSVCLDHSHDLTAAWQPQGGLLKNLVVMPKGRSDAPILEWSPSLGGFSVSLEVRDVPTNNVILQREAVRQSRMSGDNGSEFAPGVYQAVYRSKNENASEYFVIGDPREQFAKLRDDLLEYDADPSVKLNIAAQLRRAQILLAENNYNIFNREWQQKLVYTLGCLATFKHKLAEGATNITKDVPGLHIRGFASKADDSAQFYRLYVPSSYNSGTPLPLLVIAPARIVNRARSSIEGPVMANQREALRWATYAEKYGFAILWPGYRGTPEGYSYEAIRIDEAIQAVENDYNIDNGRISVFASCSAGYNAGRLVSEYPDRFAAIVYDRAVFNLKANDEELLPASRTWRETINPIPHVLGNRNLKIFVMNDNTKRPGHGEMEVTTQFLEQANATRNDVISHLDNRPMGATRQDLVFAWITPCRNGRPSDLRFSVAANAAYTGPISEIFTTPILVVRGTHASGRDQQAISSMVKSFQKSYGKRFHGAECTIKDDNDVTQDDINNHSLILIGNPQSNSVWNNLQPSLALQMTSDGVLYRNDALAGTDAFEAIVSHPSALNKYILMIGAANLQSLRRAYTTNNLFDARYDCVIFSSPRTFIGKLDDMHNITSSQAPVRQPKQNQSANKTNNKQNADNH